MKRKQFSEEQIIGILKLEPCDLPLRVSHRGDGGVLRQRLQAIAEERPRFGYRRLYVMLRREGFNVNHKRVYRMYRAAGLKLRRRLRKRVAHPRRHLVMAPVRHPVRVIIDNGPEFTGRALDTWAYAHGVSLEFIAPGRPMQNGTAESFNGKFRDECLSQHWFVNLQDARRVIEAWRKDYNEVRPHSSVGNRSPAEFVRGLAA